MPETTAHPSQEQLSAYNLGQLPPDEAVAIESHISECEPCCDTIVSLSSDDTFVGLLKEARQLPTDQTVDHGVATASSLLKDVPTQLAEHPRYEIVRLIGKGGMGDVYEARHRKMERTVALKVINRELVRKPEAVDRFHREVKTAAQLSHPNIVTAHDADQAGDFHFMVMEYVDGVDLSHIIKDRGALPIAEACDYVRKAAIGLQHAHERGMVHRDIKPHNLMITVDGTVKVLDFGLASLAPEALPDADTVEARGDLTAAGAIMGTPDFISPEQADDARQADIRSDIYSLGTTLYFLLSGRPPFNDGSVMHKLKSHAQVEPEQLESLRDDIPADLASVVSRMMAKDPDERFQTPAEVAEALAAFAVASHDDPTALEPPTRSRQTEAKPTKVPPRRGPFVATALAGLVLAFIAAAVFYIHSGKTTLRFEINDPDVSVSFAGESISVDTPDNKTFRVEPATEKTFVVYQNGTEIETDSLALRRGQKIVLKIDVVEGQIKIASNGGDVQVARTDTRPKQAGQNDGALSDHANIKGTWRVSYSEDSGRIAPQEMLENIRFVFTEHTMTTEIAGRKSESTYQLDPSTNPKSVDFTENGRTKPGIYDLQGDTLRICIAEGQPERPTAFDSQPDSPNDLILILKRMPSALEKRRRNTLDRFVDIHTPGVREAALRVSSRNNMKHMVFALLEHYEKKQQWPDGLDELLPLLDNNHAVFDNPLTGDKPGYEYVKPSGPLEEIQAAETIVLYQLRNGQRDRKLAVAYLDGRVPESCAARIKILEHALDTYKLDNGTYPSTEKGLRELVQKPADEKSAENWSGPYLKELPTDPWGNAFEYAFPGTRGGDATRPDIWSRGPDGKHNTDDDIGNWEPSENQQASLKNQVSADELAKMANSLSNPGNTADETAHILVHDRKFGRRALYKAIAHGDAIVPLIQKESKDFTILDSRNAFWIAEVLGAIQTDSSRKVLVDLYSRTNELARLTGAVGLARQGALADPVDESSFLVRTVRTVPNETETQLAILALGLTMDEKALPCLLDILKKRPLDKPSIGSGTHAYACEAIASIGSKDAIPVLRDCMKSEQFYALPSAFNALIALGDREAVPLAIARLTPEVERNGGGEVLLRELRKVTGETYDYDQAKWKAWWSSVERKWQLPEANDDEGDPSSRLKAARHELTEMRTRYTDKHPLVLSQLQKIAELERQAASPAGSGELGVARARLVELRTRYTDKHPLVLSQLRKIARLVREAEENGRAELAE